MTNNPIFDHVFRTLIEKMPQLVIPLLNEIFHTSYPENIKISQKRNEHQTNSGEIITDSHLLIADKTYHIECQSTYDTEMVIRMIECDFSISLESIQKESGRYCMYFPHSCILYLRGNKTEELLQKRLFFLLPFFILRYEKIFLYENEQELSKLLREYTSIELSLENFFFFLPFCFVIC